MRGSTLGPRVRWPWSRAALVAVAGAALGVSVLLSGCSSGKMSDSDVSLARSVAAVATAGYAVSTEVQSTNRPAEPSSEFLGVYLEEPVQEEPDEVVGRIASALSSSYVVVSDVSECERDPFDADLRVCYPDFEVEAVGRVVRVEGFVAGLEGGYSSFSLRVSVS